MKIGIYIGSFNPVHKGHIKIVNHLLNKNYLDKVIIIPTGNYWDKTNLANIKDRVNMLKIFKNERITIDTKNNDIPYTYLVLNEIKKEYKDDEISLIIGADNIINFDKWKNYKEILAHNLIILNRNDINIKIYLDKLNKTDKYQIVSDLDLINISSTMIRNCIKLKNYNELDKYIDEEVLSYIKNKKLYE